MEASRLHVGSIWLDFGIPDLPWTWRDPQGLPRDPQASPKDPKGPPQDSPRTTLKTPWEPQRPPKEPPRSTKEPQGSPKRPQGPPPRPPKRAFGVFFCSPSQFANLMNSLQIAAYSWGRPLPKASRTPWDLPTDHERPPNDPLGPPKYLQGHPKDSQGPPKDPPRTSKDLLMTPKDHPRTSKGEPRTPRASQGACRPEPARGTESAIKVVSYTKCLVMFLLWPTVL